VRPYFTKQTEISVSVLIKFKMNYVRERFIAALFCGGRNA